MEIREFVRKPKKVEAVRVTSENMTQVANWCLGEIRAYGPYRTGPKFFIQVQLYGAFSGSENILGRADVGNWVVKTGSGFRIYSNSRFKAKFVKLGIDEGGSFWGYNFMSTKESPWVRSTPVGAIDDIQITDEGLTVSGHFDPSSSSSLPDTERVRKVTAYSYPDGSYLVEANPYEWLTVKP